MADDPSLLTADGLHPSAKQFAGWVELYLHYIDHWSLWLDLWILLCTPLAVLRRDGAHRGSGARRNRAPAARGEAAIPLPRPQAAFAPRSRRAAGGQAELYVADITDAAQVKQMADAHYGNKDCVMYRDFFELLDEHCTLSAQISNHVFVVNHLVANIDRGAVLLEREIHNVDRPIDAGAKSTRIGKIDFHSRRSSSGQALQGQRVCNLH